MSPINQALNASAALKRYYGPSAGHEDPFPGELTTDSTAEFYSRCAFVSEDLDSWPNRFVGDIHSVLTIVHISGDPASASDVFLLNAPYGSVISVQRAIRLWARTENAEASRDFISAIDQLNAQLASLVAQSSAPELAVEAVSPSPHLPPVVLAELAEFSAGLDGVCPTEEAVRIARRVSAAAVQHARHPEIAVDVDGELSFDLRLKDGRLVFAELGLDGRLDVGVYGSDNEMLVHDAQATCQYLLSIIES